MAYGYVAVGKQIFFEHRNGEIEIRSVCDEAQKACDILNKAMLLNEKRKYTASARLNAEVESLPGFRDVADDEVDLMAEAQSNYQRSLGI